MEINIGIEKGNQQQVAQKLSLILADTYVLYVKTQNFHWNIIDPRFYFLHLFLEKQYEELAEGIDELAERIRMLGQRAPGSLKEFLEISSLNENGSDKETHGDAILNTLLADRMALCRYIRKSIEESQELGDEGSADLLIKHLRMHENMVWMIHSHFKF